jgi:DNA-binding FadR family transcriptional regulator
MLTMEHSLGVFIAGRQVHIHSLLEVRRALEPVGAELAAMHRTPEDLEQIEQLFSRHEQAVGDLPAFLRANVDWHIAVVKAGHNDLLHALILALSSAILKGTELDDFASEAVRLGTIRAHRSVVDAIRKRDASRARRSMERHLTAYQDEVSRHPELDQLTLDSGIPEPAPRNGLSRPDT